MSAKHYLTTAHNDVAPLRKRLNDFGFVSDVDRAIDVVDLARGVCDCEVVLVSELSEARALAILRDEFAVDVTGVSAASESPLSGALCVANAGSLRWILVREEDIYERQRFTIAHELGHLFIEVEPEIERLAVMPTASVLSSSATELRIFNRCSTEEPVSGPLRVATASESFTKADLREIRAHHFAAELLMPYEGVKRLLSSFGGYRGIRTLLELNVLVKAVATQYEVSGAAARRRIEKDFGTIPSQQHSNADLFD